MGKSGDVFKKLCQSYGQRSGEQATVLLLFAGKTVQREVLSFVLSELPLPFLSAYFCSLRQSDGVRSLFNFLPFLCCWEQYPKLIGYT